MICNYNIIEDALFHYHSNKLFQYLYSSYFQNPTTKTKNMFGHYQLPSLDRRGGAGF